MKYSCDICGRFIPVKDLELGLAIVRLVAVDSDYSIEEHETVCKKCKKEEYDIRDRRD